MFRSLKGLGTEGYADAKCAIAVVVALVGEKVWTLRFGPSRHIVLRSGEGSGGPITNIYC